MLPNSCYSLLEPEPPILKSFAKSPSQFNFVIDLKSCPLFYLLRCITALGSLDHTLNQALDDHMLLKPFLFLIHPIFCLCTSQNSLGSSALWYYTCVDSICIRQSIYERRHWIMKKNNCILYYFCYKHFLYLNFIGHTEISQDGARRICCDLTNMSLTINTQYNFRQIIISMFFIWKLNVIVFSQVPPTYW